MKNKKSTTQDIEDVLQEIGNKIEALIQKGAEAGADVREEIEQKIKDLKDNKTSLEEELRKGKEMLEREFQEKKEELEPRIQESKGFMKEGFKQIFLGIKALFGKK
jgi:predicted nuclease with TOPRIM domain